MADRRALVITAPGSIALQGAAELIPGPGEIVARPVHVGICGTDLELLAGVVDPAYVRYPLVPGHEWSGIVAEVGPGVTGLEPGQPVIAEGIIPDRICAECVAGHTNLCLVYDELGFTRAGAAADQVLLPVQVVHVLGPSVSLLEAALAEPAAVAWRAIGRGRPRPGERVAVVGDGTLALLTAHLLRLYSPAELIVCGQRPAQAALAVELGATGFALDAAAGPFDLVIEAAGTAGAVERAWPSPPRRPGGTDRAGRERRHGPLPDQRRDQQRPADQRQLRLHLCGLHRDRRFAQLRADQPRPADHPPVPARGLRRGLPGAPRQRRPPRQSHAGHRRAVTREPSAG
jgi:threonine dehydrogenase-like Zn-dependent dehydrogenase